MRLGAPEDCTNLKSHGRAPFFTDNLSNYHLPNLPIVHNEYHHPYTSETQSSSSTYNVLSDETRADFLPISESFDSVFARTGLPDLKSLDKNKRKRKSSTVLEKPNEVIHVRAKRGQATDSHSSAERVRREKINEKLRCLQDLVPGCYKTMGMAVMLDVIIDYIHSLQHQIEFLSSKLSEASINFNATIVEIVKAVQTMQENCAYES